MSLARGAIRVFFVAVLLSSATAMVGCTCDDAALSPGTDPGAAASGEATETAGTTRTDDASASSDGEGATGDTAGTASSSGSLDDEELAALEAELEAMESELGSLALPDNDFGDIEALLD